jgi:2-haloacid dehalogenase
VDTQVSTRLAPVRISAIGLNPRAMRWATFDCYGTLIDWNRGLGDELARLFGEERRERLLARYHELEPAVQKRAPDLRYRDVLSSVLAELAREQELELADGERDALARSLPEWPPFSEVPEALRGAQRAGWRLAILSNTDRDLIESSMRRLGVEFELAIVASEIGSYKPEHGHWRVFFERTGADPSSHVHVAASLYHDIEPAHELGLKSIWTNRLGERASVSPTRELPDLSRLAETLDELVPGAGGASPAENQG